MPVPRRAHNLDPSALAGVMISRVAISRAKAGRAHLYAGKLKIATIATDDVQRLALARGVTLDESLASAIAQSAARLALRSLALNILNRRAVSKVQLVRSLTARGHDAAAARALAEEFEQRGLINEQAYAEALANHVLRGKPAGAGLVRRKLAQRGIARPIAESVTRAAGAAQDGRARALELARRLLRRVSLAQADPLARRRRLAGAIARRGFDPAEVRYALEHALKRSREEDDRHAPESDEA